MGFASICLALVAFLIGLGLDFFNKTSTPLHEHLGRAIAASGVPPAFVLICGSFKPDILIKVPGLEVPILFGGLSLLYVSFKAAFRTTPPTAPAPPTTPH